MAGRSAYNDSTGIAAMGHSTRDLESNALSLLNASLAPSTQQSYKRSKQKFANFSQSLVANKAVFPANTHTVLMFIAFLFARNYSSESIMTYQQSLMYMKFSSGKITHTNIYYKERTDQSKKIA